MSECKHPGAYKTYESSVWRCDVCHEPVDITKTPEMVAEIETLTAKLQAAEAEVARLENEREMAFDWWVAHRNDPDPRDARIAELEATVNRLTSRGIEDMQHRIAELEALAAENDAAYRIWRRRCEAAESRIAELEAENNDLIVKVQFAEAVIRDEKQIERIATEAALKYAYSKLSDVLEAYDRGVFISKALKALLGEDE